MSQSEGLKTLESQMSKMRLLKNLTVLVTTAFVLMACTEAQFVMSTAKRLDSSQKSQSKYKVGKPYQVKGVWYYPREDWFYDRTGTASWYGPNFDGMATANGEIFSQWGVSAAHKTLPLPSIVRVTNLDNGRSLVVRVNDRGPFVSNRIIDLSRRAAQLLGFEGQGTARVRVQVLAAESKALARRGNGQNPPLLRSESPIKTVNVASLPIASEPLPVKVVAVSRPQISQISQVSQAPRVSALSTRVYVQAGAFSNKANAEQVRQRLARIGRATVTPFPVNGRKLFRVRIGPVGDTAAADRLLAQVVHAGYIHARTVME